MNHRSSTSYGRYLAQSQKNSGLFIFFSMHLTNAAKKTKKNCSLLSMLFDCQREYFSQVDRILNDFISSQRPLARFPFGRATEMFALIFLRGCNPQDI